MNKIVKSLVLFCVLITTINPSFSEDVNRLHVSEYHSNEETNPHNTDTTEQFNKNKGLPEGRNIADAAADKKHNLENPSKPLRSIFLGIYKNYKSTYLGNKTLTEYKQTLRENMKNKQQQEQQDDLKSSTEVYENDAGVTEYSDHQEASTTTDPQPSTTHQTKIKLSLNNRKRKLNATHTENGIQHYNVGPALNLSLDMNNNIVKVNLEAESLKELVTGRWLNDNTEEGRGKKYDMVTRILPLFILPFLIQSAIVPFLVTKLKLLLMKSILVGKLAIFLLIISAFRNSNKQMQTYEVAPSYWSGEPSRRSELAAAASNMAYNGYRVEGKPAAWVN